MINYNIGDLITRLNNGIARDNTSKTLGPLALKARGVGELGGESGKSRVEVPFNKETVQVLTELQKMGVVGGFKTMSASARGAPLREAREGWGAVDSQSGSPLAQPDRAIHIELGGVMRHKLSIISKPGKRVYTSYKEIATKLGGGYNTYILRTSEGIMSSQVALRRQIGGELLIKVESS